MLGFIFLFLLGTGCHGRRGRGGPPMSNEAYPCPEPRVTAEVLVLLYPLMAALGWLYGGGFPSPPVVDGVKPFVIF